MKTEHKKIAILGNCGSGKTTLGIEISAILQLPIYHLDQYYYRENWEKVPFREYLENHNRLCNQDKWIIDGTAARTLDYRLERADCVIFLDIPRTICLWRVLVRLLFNWGKVRYSSAEGCKERFNLEFFKWVWNFDKRKFSFYDSLDKLKSTEVYIIKSDYDKENILNLFRTKK